MFQIPVVLFIFKREKAVEIIKAISIHKPKKVYLIGDGPRNNEEKNDVIQCRKLVEDAIDWDCEIVKNYAEKNRGVYENIGKGALWVFEREDSAIFLEDDNLPEETFLPFCEEMLNKYWPEERILWVCGTNYLEKYDGSEYSYVFTRHMLPCGWASWSHKFKKYYDGEFKTLNPDDLSYIKDRFIFPSLYREMRNCWLSEYNRIQHGDKPISWDYQMDYSIKSNDLLGICPKYNQISNIGADEHSIHGGTSIKKTMTSRFCEKKSYPLQFPLKHPDYIEIDKTFETRIGRIILPPLRMRTKWFLLSVVRKVLKIPYGISTKEYIKNGLKD